MATFTVYVKRGANRVPVSFDSPYTLPEAIDRLKLLPDKFARELAAKSTTTGLSGLQVAWVHKLVVDAGKSPAAGVEADLTGIVALFATAAKRLKRPKITLQIGGVTIGLAMAGPRAKYPGNVYVTDGEGYGRDQWFGRIDAAGKLVPGRDLTDAVRDAMVALSKDPAGYASEYGKRSGRCCFCHRELTDERSVAVGYGETCAGNYGLPWGGAPTRITADTTFTAAPDREQQMTLDAVLAAMGAQQ